MENRTFSDRNFQVLVGNLLRYGVWLALVISAIGAVLYLARHGQEPINYAGFIEKDKSIGQLMGELFAGLGRGSAESVIFLGVIVLFLTPVLRLVLCLISFLIEGDWLYVIISLIVIGIVAFSVMLGYTH